MRGEPEIHPYRVDYFFTAGMDNPVRDFTTPYAGAVEQCVDDLFGVRSDNIGHIAINVEAELVPGVVPVVAHRAERLGHEPAGEAEYRRALLRSARFGAQADGGGTVTEEAVDHRRAHRAVEHVRGGADLDAD